MQWYRFSSNFLFVSFSPFIFPFLFKIHSFPQFLCEFSSLLNILALSDTKLQFSSFKNKPIFIRPSVWFTNAVNKQVISFYIFFLSSLFCDLIIIYCLDWITQLKLSKPQSNSCLFCFSWKCILALEKAIHLFDFKTK